MSLESVADRLQTCNTVAILSGAGISAESGVPTFRDSGGLYEGKSAYELASPQGFSDNPELVWNWYEMRRDAIRKVKPNPGHFALVEMENLFDGVYIITQNVDGLHRQAGSNQIVELHGNLNSNICHQCREPSQSTAPRNEPCQLCGGPLRPGVVWFGEPLDQQNIELASQWLHGSDALMVIGTSGVVYPAAGFAHMAKAQGKYVVEINSAETELSSNVDDVIRSPSGEALPLLATMVKQLRA